MVVLDVVADQPRRDVTAIHQDEEQLFAWDAEPVGQLSHGGARRHGHLLAPALRAGVTGDRIEKPDLDADVTVRNVVAGAGGRGVGERQ